MCAKSIWRPMALVGVLAAILLTPLCGLWFSCGCNWPWAGFYSVCNALREDAPAPHCPWCVYPVLAALAIGLSAAAPLLAVLKFPALRRGGTAAMLYTAGSGIVLFTLALALAGWLTAILTHHPSFLGHGLTLT